MTNRNASKNVQQHNYLESDERLLPNKNAINIEWWTTMGNELIGKDMLECGVVKIT